MPPPFVHGYGAKGKSILQLWGNVNRLPTLPESIWGNGTTVPLWALVGKKGSGPVRLQLFPGVPMYWKKEVLSSCKATPTWRSRPNTPKGQLAMLAAASHAWFAQADLPWTLFVEDTKATPVGLSQYWDDGLAMRVQQALAAFRLSCFPVPAPKALLNACRGVSVALHQWDEREKREYAPLCVRQYHPHRQLLCTDGPGDGGIPCSVAPASGCPGVGACSVPQGGRMWLACGCES